LSESELTTTTSPASTDPGADAIYSAKAARQGIQPNIAFKHLLSRLQFQVKTGLSNGDGIKVTAIKVRSLSTGKMIVAYKYKDAEGDVAEPTRIVWDPAQTALKYNGVALPQLALKQRNAGTGAMEDLDEVELDWTPAVYTAVANGTTLTNGNTYYTSNTGAGEFVSDGTELSDGTNYFVLTTPAVPGVAEVKSVGEALIVAPQDKYEIEVDYKMDVQTARKWYKSYTPAVYTAVADGTTLTLGETYYTSDEGAGEFVSDGTELSDGTNYFVLTTPADIDLSEGDLTGDPTTYNDKLVTDLVRTTIDPQTTEALAFAAGESYLVTITLYGPEEIKITTTLTAWDPSDDDIEIGQD